MNATQAPATLNKGGRPSCRTPDIAEAVCKAIGLGVPFRHACAVARISYSTFCDWRKDDEQFREQVETSLAEGVQRRLQVIEMALLSQDESIRLRASCWWLEHRLPEHFSKTRLEVTGADGEPLAGIIILPRKDDTNGKPVVTVENGPKEIGG